MARNKFGNVRVEVDGLKFDSKGEAGRWQELQLLQRAGMISDLERQVPYQLIVNGQKITKYIADFRYRENGAEVVEDFKGFRTELFKVKSKLMAACLGIEVVEV